MASVAVLLVFHIERLLAVMAFAAEIALGQLVHVHLVGALLHLEDRVMAAGALETLFVHVFLMAENDRARIFRRERYVSAADLFGKNRERNQQATDNNSD